MVAFLIFPFQMLHCMTTALLPYLGYINILGHAYFFAGFLSPCHWISRSGWASRAHSPCFPAGSLQPRSTVRFWNTSSALCLGSTGGIAALCYMQSDLSDLCMWTKSCFQSFCAPGSWIVAPCDMAAISHSALCPLFSLCWCYGEKKEREDNNFCANWVAQEFGQ